MWQWLMSDVTTVAKDVLELTQSRPEKQVYMSLPRPGVSNSMIRFAKYSVASTTNYSCASTEARDDQQTSETGEAGQRGAGENSESRPRDEAHNLGDGCRDGKVAGER